MSMGIIRAITLTLTLFVVVNVNAQLSDKELESLKNKVMTDIEMDEIGDGARVYQTSKHWTLVSFATVSSGFKPSQQNRQAQIMASRNAIEFLKGAKNKATSVYDAYSEKSETLTEKKGSGISQEDQEISSNTTSNINENSQSVEKETMSERIVQQSIRSIDGLQPLFRHKGDEGVVYVYYMVISKQSAKKKR